MLRSAAIALVAALALDGTAAVGVLHLAPQEIVPPIENVASDKKFYGPPFPTDYPHDKQPKLRPDMVAEHAGSTYPKLRDAHLADKDYIQDENNDRGEWAAQMAYDKSRVRITKEEELIKKAKEEAAKEEEEAEAAEKELEAADAAEAEATKAAEQAEGEAKTAEDAEKAAEQAEKDEGKKEEEKKEEAEKEKGEAMTKEQLGEKLAAAEEHYKKEEEQFKKCQAELEEAKAELEKLRMQHAAALAASPTGDATVTVAVVSHADAIRLAQSRADAAKAKRDAAKAKVNAVAANKDKLQAEFSREKRQSVEASKTVEKETVQLHKAQDEMKASQAHLRTARGIPEPEVKSAAGALPTASALVAILAVAAAAL